MSDSNNDYNSYLHAYCNIHILAHVFFTRVSILQMSKLSLREVKCLAQNNVTRKLSEPSLIPRPLNSKCVQFVQNWGLEKLANSSKASDISTKTFLFQVVEDTAKWFKQ